MLSWFRFFDLIWAFNDRHFVSFVFVANCYWKVQLQFRQIAAANELFDFLKIIIIFKQYFFKRAFFLFIISFTFTLLFFSNHSDEWNQKAARFQRPHIK